MTECKADCSTSLFVKENDYQTEKVRTNIDFRELKKKKKTRGNSKTLLSIPHSLRAPGQMNESHD